MRKVAKKIKKPNRKKLIFEADKLWASIVKERDGKCIYCGSTRNLNAHHIFTKARHGNLRWEPDNGVTLCAGCHTFGVHINPAPYMLRIIEYVGNDTMERLRVQAQTKPTPLRLDDIQSVVDSLQIFVLSAKQ
jgi:hypothetical protein